MGFEWGLRWGRRWVSERAPETVSLRAQTMEAK